MVTGRSDESSTRLAVCITLFAPNPATPWITVAPAKPFPAQTFQQDAMQWRVMKLVRFSEEDPYQALVPIQYSHCDLPRHYRPTSPLAHSIPSQPATSAPATVAVMFTAARPGEPSPSSRVVS